MHMQANNLIKLRRQKNFKRLKEVRKGSESDRGIREENESNEWHQNKVYIIIKEYILKYILI